MRVNIVLGNPVGKGVFVILMSYYFSKLYFASFRPYMWMSMESRILFLIL